LAALITKQKGYLDLDKSWTKIIAITGSVGVFALLFSLLMRQVFNENIINLLGSERVFYIIICLLFVFTTGILIALLKPSSTKNIPEGYGTLPDSTQPQPSNNNKDISVTYKDNSTHNGSNHF
jgi:hypothetical protein